MWYKKNKRIISLFMAVVMLVGVLVSNVQPSYIRADESAVTQESTDPSAANSENATQTQESTQAVGGGREFREKESGG